MVLTSPTRPRSEPAELDRVGARAPLPAQLADDRMQALYSAHARALYRFLLRLTFGERAAAEDLLQETLLRAWRHLDGLTADVETLRPWLFTVARRIAIDAARARRARPAEVAVLDLGALPSRDDPIEAMLTVQTVRQALNLLSPEHRGVLIEIYFRGRSAREAATVLGIPEGTVKSRAHYAVRFLRTAITAPNQG
jgi:RNA polymerase sigma-70 factor (ECF subfamily)